MAIQVTHKHDAVESVNVDTGTSSVSVLKGRREESAASVFIHVHHMADVEVHLSADRTYNSVTWNATVGHNDQVDEYAMFLTDDDLAKLAAALNEHLAAKAVS